MLERTSRPSPDDLLAVGRLLDRATAAGAEPLSDHLLVELHARRRTGAPEHDSVFAWIHDHDHTDLVAYGQASRAGGAWVLGVVIAPEARHDPLGRQLTGELLSCLVEGIADLGGGHATWWVHEADDEDRRVAESAGLFPGRVLLQMRRPLPLDQHATVDHRGFRVGIDDDAWLIANNRAFAGHAEQGGWDRDALALRLAEPWFDAEGLRVLDRNGRIIAFCWTKVHPARAGDPEMGEIYVIGVDPDAHGQGLGRELTLAGLDHLAARGVATGMLFVDDANAAAVHLYRDLGFVTHHREFAFTSTVEPHQS